MAGRLVANGRGPRWFSSGGPADRPESFSSHHIRNRGSNRSGGWYPGRRIRRSDRVSGRRRRATPLGSGRYGRSCHGRFASCARNLGPSSDPKILLRPNRLVAGAVTASGVSPSCDSHPPMGPSHSGRGHAAAALPAPALRSTPDRILDRLSQPGVRARERGSCPEPRAASDSARRTPPARAGSREGSVRASSRPPRPRS